MLKNILVLDDGTEIAAGTAGANAIRALTVTETVSSTDDLCPGGACANKLEITIWVEPGSALAITSGTRLRHYRADAAGTRTLCGTYWAVKPTRQSRNTYKIYAYDAVSKLDGIQSTWLRSIQGDFPMTLWAFAQRVAQRCGLTITNTELPRSGDYQVQAFYADNLTGRQLLAWVAEASGTFLRATPAGDLEFAWYTGFAGYGIGPGDDAAGVPTALGLSGPLLGTVDGLVWTFRRAQNGYFQGGLSYEDYETAPLDKVQIKQSDDDVGVIYPPDETGTNAIVIQGNLLLTTASADALRPVAQALYEQLHSVTYTPLEVSLPLTAGAPAPGQIIAVTDAWGRTMQAYVMQRTVTGQRMTLTCTGNARRDGTAAVNSQTWQNLQGKMLELQIGVDGLNVKASELQGDYAKLELTVDGISTEVSNMQGDMTTLEQTVDSFTLSVTKSSDVELFGGSVWKSSDDGVAVNGKTVAITAPSSGMSEATLDVPAENLQKMGDNIYTVSVEYRVTETINTGNNASGIVLWMDYPDGNLSSWVKLLYNPGGGTTPTQGWTTATIEMTGKSQPPTRVYMFAYLYSGSGKMELRNPSLRQKSAGSVISLTSNGVTIGAAEGIVQTGETREAFAQSDHSVTIKSGTITFAANTLVVDSDNFKLKSDGTVSITGDFYTQTDNNKVSVYNGQIALARKVSNGQWKDTATLWSYGTNDANGMLYLYGPGTSGNQVYNVNLYSSYNGGGISVYNAAQQVKFQVLINGSGDAEVWVNGTKRF